MHVQVQLLGVDHDAALQKIDSRAWWLSEVGRLTDEAGPNVDPLRGAARRIV